ncbi:MAG: hypothetical protein FWG89_03800 [Treponema sp.]|nr:hypothetical protein [Treponema sp.]
MKIRINDADADILLETEKNVGEILCALESWLTGSGHRLSGLCIDGETINSSAMETCFSREIDKINTLDIFTSSLPELIAESLFCVLREINAYETATYEEKNQFAENWKDSPEACLLAEQCPDIFSWTTQTFAGEGSGTQALRSITEERIRELQDPAGETGRIQLLVSDICTRLEEFSLDIQTGKDSRAAETVNFFSGVAEKIFRIYNILIMEGYPVKEIMVDTTPIDEYISEFSTALGELLAAYEQSDSVLVGDIAEYEMAPRLRKLHSVILNGIS